MSFTEKILSYDIWNISGDFGRVKTDDFEYATETYRIKSKCTEDENKVYHYTGEFKNISDKKISLNCLKAKFHLGGGEFAVYTQYNGWQNENIGGWQLLNTEVTASVRSIRAAYGAAPFMAIKNKQTGRGTVFHLLPDYEWSIQARLVPKGGETAKAEVEIGVNSENFLYELLPNESIKTPEIIFYEFKNDTDLDCWKLHSYWIKNYKRKSMPIVYNTWLCRFDRINYENIDNQIAKAEKIGAEYFVIDAGWFGSGEDWGKQRGDWFENMTGGFCGTMNKISENVGKHNMKFGLWFEIESASAEARVLKERGEYFRESNGLFFLDFSNPEAVEYIFEVLKENIEKYNIEYLKFDFNQDMDFDDEHGAYIDYFKGYRSLTDKIKSSYPNIYLENCASGGMRADLRNSKDFDSFWLSDNQSPYEGMRIFKEGIKRLPPQCIEKWAVLRSIKDFAPDCYCKENEKIISTNDAIWDGTVGVHQSFLNGFLSGGPIGISCDLNEMSDKLLDNISHHTAHFKEERSFWENAVCRICADTDKILILEYRAFDKAKIIIYTYKIMQDAVYVYPDVNENYIYTVENREMTGKDISENGIRVALAGNYRATFLEIKRKR